MSGSKVVNFVLSPTSMLVLNCLFVLFFILTGTYKVTDSPLLPLRYVTLLMYVFLIVISIVGLAMPDHTETTNDSENDSNATATK